MQAVKVKYFDHSIRDWAYLQDNGADALFPSYPEAQDAVMRRQPRAYNEDEFQIEAYIVCECGGLVKKEQECSICEQCGATYDRWGERVWTSYRT